MKLESLNLREPEDGGGGANSKTGQLSGKMPAFSILKSLEEFWLNRQNFSRQYLKVEKKKLFGYVIIGDVWSVMKKFGEMG